MKILNSNWLSNIKLGNIRLGGINLGNANQVEKIPKWFDESLVCWYDPKKQKLTNDIIQSENTANGYFTLRDFSKNHLDMKAYGFAGEGMSGMGGYGIDFKNIRINNVPVDSSNVGYYIESNYDFVNIHTTIDFKENFVENLYIKNMKNGMKFKIKGGKYGWIFKDGWRLDSNIIGEIDPNSEGVVTAVNDNIVWIAPKIKIPANTEFTIKQLPLYPDALVFDGVDDYAVSEGQPILTDYTWTAKRDILDSYKADQWYYEKRDSSGNMGAFAMYTNNGKFFTYSFGEGGVKSVAPPLKISWQTKNSYNGTTIDVGDNIDGKILKIGRGTIFALYQFLLFNRTLTQEEIDWVKEHIMGELQYISLDEGKLDINKLK